MLVPQDHRPADRGRQTAGHADVQGQAGAAEAGAAMPVRAGTRRARPALDSRPTALPTMACSRASRDAAVAYGPGASPGVALPSAPPPGPSAALPSPSPLPPSPSPLPSPSLLPSPSAGAVCAAAPGGAAAAAMAELVQPDA